MFAGKAAEMVQSKGGRVARELETLWSSGTLTGASDAQLLDRFTVDRDATAELAFRELVERHAPMVMGVCRQIVRRPHDVDDAFQATFLVLVRKARSIRVSESLGPWLYKVAYRTAQRARVSASRQASTGLEDVESAASIDEYDAALETAPLLHDEIGKLPEKYRSPIVLCHLEGKTHEEAARVLNWPVGTLSGRLSRGRAMLKGRLERRGLAVPMAAVSRPFLNLSEPPPGALIASTMKSAFLFAASQPVAPNVLSLTQGVLRTMLLHKIKTVSLAMLVVGSVSGIGGALALRAAQKPTQREPEPRIGVDVTAVAAPAGEQTPQLFDPQQAGQGLGLPIPVDPFQGMNAPNLAKINEPIPAFGIGPILLVKSQDGRAIEAWSDDVDQDTTGGWQRFLIPEGLKVDPIVGPEYTGFGGGPGKEHVAVVAFRYKGKTIDEVAALSARHGLWQRMKLRVPIEGSLAPLVGPGCVLYQVGNIFYAFSAEKGAWAVLELPAEAKEKPRASTTTDHILVQQGKRLYAFSLKQGKWSMPVEMDLPAKSK
jgi:RNA polymerase sigma factor (sigma-70 family)